MALSPGGEFLASGRRVIIIIKLGPFDNTIRLWNVRSEKEIRKLRGHDDGVTSVVFSPDSELLASGRRLKNKA